MKQTILPALFLWGIISLLSCGNQEHSARKKAIPVKDDIPGKEQELIRIDQKMTELYYGDPDSMLYYSKLFDSRLEDLLANEKTLAYPFKSLIKESACNVTTSKDGLFRIYSWDSNLGGTMHFFNVIYQYKSGKTVTMRRYESDEEADPAWFCSGIYALKTKKHTYYLAITNGIYSTKDVRQSINAFEITDKGLNDSLLLMKTADGLQNALSVYYDFFSVVDRPERPVSVIQYDPAKQTILLSETNEKDEITAGTQTYSFNGTYFEKSK